jgi:hypothetical protein
MNIIRNALVVVALSSLLVPVYAQSSSSRAHRHHHGYHHVYHHGYHHRHVGYRGGYYRHHHHGMYRSAGYRVNVCCQPVACCPSRACGCARYY